MYSPSYDSSDSDSSDGGSRDVEETYMWDVGSLRPTWGPHVIEDVVVRTRGTRNPFTSVERATRHLQKKKEVVKSESPAFRLQPVQRRAQLNRLANKHIRQWVSSFLESDKVVWPSKPKFANARELLRAKFKNRVRSDPFEFVSAASHIEVDHISEQVGALASILQTMMPDEEKLASLSNTLDMYRLVLRSAQAFMITKGVPRQHVAALTAATRSLGGEETLRPIRATFSDAAGLVAMFDPVANADGRIVDICARAIQQEVCQMYTRRLMVSPWAVSQHAIMFTGHVKGTHVNATLVAKHLEVGLRSLMGSADAFDKLPSNSAKYNAARMLVALLAWVVVDRYEYTTTREGEGLDVTAYMESPGRWATSEQAPATGGGRPKRVRDLKPRALRVLWEHMLDKVLDVKKLATVVSNATKTGTHSTHFVALTAILAAHGKVEVQCANSTLAGTGSHAFFPIEHGMGVNIQADVFGGLLMLLSVMQTMTYSAKAGASKRAALVQGLARVGAGDLFHARSTVLSAGEGMWSHKVMRQSPGHNTCGAYALSHARAFLSGFSTRVIVNSKGPASKRQEATEYAARDAWATCAFTNVLPGANVAASQHAHQSATVRISVVCAAMVVECLWMSVLADRANPSPRVGQASTFVLADSDDDDESVDGGAEESKGVDSSADNRGDMHSGTVQASPKSSSSGRPKHRTTPLSRRPRTTPVSTPPSTATATAAVASSWDIQRPVAPAPTAVPPDNDILSKLQKRLKQHLGHFEREGVDDPLVREFRALQATLNNIDSIIADPL